jgi:Tripartite tricarboxylate transporter family receptor
LAALSFDRRADAAFSDPMHILCSGPAGSIPDLVARAVGEHLPTILGRHVVVDNRPGAAGQISVSALKAAPADGSTLLLAQGAIATVYPYLYTKLAYDPAVDLQPVSVASEMVLGLAIGPAVPTKWRRSATSSPGSANTPATRTSARRARGRCLTCWRRCCSEKKVSHGSRCCEPTTFTPTEVMIRR